MTGKGILVRGLCKSYGSKPVLWDLDLDVNWGQILVLFGANGAGKTTLLRIISTQARADSGTIQVAGYNARRQDQNIRQNVGVVAHQSLMYEDMTARENLMFYAKMYRIDDIKLSVEEVLVRVGLESRADDRLRTLSHGMQKRLAIARATLHDPKVLILDEPEAGLDEESTGNLENLLYEWVQKDKAVLMTTHNIDIGTNWASRVAILSDGSINEIDSIEAEDIKRKLYGNSMRLDVNYD
ncbi:MAG: heme ABC exporter ATP-binding protein CcmA [Chloroflexota bacterium]|nr:heme ABC exporter ATP-binding protein CcmA [Chloroflexota bacterium]